jgi:hypothetical protein
MDQNHFPWRLLGTLLVDQGLLTEAQLELALQEQRRTGRLLGQIVVDFGYVSAFALARALTAQHGIELRGPSESAAKPAIEARTRELEHPEPAGRQTEAQWRPLGKLLVESGIVSKADLDQAIAEQRRHGRRLGEILVERGCLSGADLARVLAVQHGVGSNAVGADFETVVQRSTSPEAVYQVWEVLLAPTYNASSVLYSSANFLDAADFTFEFIEEHEPEALEIQRRDGARWETLWTYSARRAAAVAETRKDLVGTFGFDPTTWDGSPPARDFTGSSDR